MVDLALSNGSGLGVLHAMRGRAVSQRIVLLSNCVTPGIRRRCGQLGADAIFDKTTELEAFLACCNA